MVHNPNDTGQTGGQHDGGSGGRSLVERILDGAFNNFVVPGVPYVYGGTSHSGVDCSGLIQLVYGNHGINLPRIADAQARVGKPVSAKNARPGDLVYFENDASKPGYDHIGIYIGHGKMIVAPHTGENVQIQDVGTAAGFDRVLPHSAWAGMHNDQGQFVWQRPDGQPVGQGQMRPQGSGVSGSGKQGDPVPNAALGSPKPQSVQSYLDNPDVASTYGYLAAYLKNPEIGPILARAAKHGWGQAELLGALEKTKWWKRTSESARNWQAQQRLDPATARERLRQMRQQIQQLAISTLGHNFDPQRANHMANAAIASNWSQAQLQAAIGAEFKYHGAQAAYKGAAGQTIDKLRQLSSAYLVPISHDTMQNWTRRILEGTTTTDDYTSYLTSQAESLFPTLTHALKTGQTVADYLDPYAQLASQILEKPVGDFNFMHPKWGKALNTVQEDGSRAPMTLSDWATYLRGLPEYEGTQQADQQAAGFAVSLGNIFGKISTPSSTASLNASQAVM